jgi:hypothetical protein
VARGRGIGRRRSGELDAILARDDRRHAVDAGLDAAGDVARAELRDDRAIADLADEAVGQGALDAVAGCNEKLAILDRDEKEDPVVLVLVARLPGLGEPHRTLGDRIGLGRADGHDGDLGAGLLLELADAVGESRLGAGVDDAGEVGHEADRRRQRGRRRVGPERDRQEEADGREEDPRAPHRAGIPACPRAWRGFRSRRDSRRNGSRPRPGRVRS